MNYTTAKRWFSWHKWTSLVCTLFLLMLCITGLPLIFHHEINDLSDPPPKVDHTLPDLSLDAIVSVVKKLEPEKVIRFIFWDEETPGAVYTVVSNSLREDPYDYKVINLHRKTGKVYKSSTQPSGFMNLMLRLHTDLFSGITGKMLIAFMGLLFIISIISGVVLYGPIMKKYEFGMIRNKSRRLKWLDMHNLLGIVTLSWAMVVGITGIINSFSDIALQKWQQGELAQMTAKYNNDALIDKNQSLYSVENVLDTALKAGNGMAAVSIAFPGTAFTSNHHYAVFMHGKTPLTSRILKPALVDALNGTLTDIRSMPWYANIIFICQPLHFGDYGGLPLKILWSLFDIATIAVLISGLILWTKQMRNTIHHKKVASK